MITFRKIEKKEVKFHVEYIEDYDSDLIVSVIVTAQWDIFEGNASYNELEYETQDDFLKSKDYELLKEQSFIDLSHKIQKGFDLLIARSNIMQLINYTIPFEITYEEQQQKGLEKYAQSHNINLPKVS
ncbi:MAG TPA: hypothetical protein P5513_06710, partial [Candidatus Diapherotrites archaeon]|nr:hypothetical protein [Candidatus Diapherotrites archaeon]